MQDTIQDSTLKLLNIFAGILGVLTIGSLIYEYGFYLESSQVQWLHFFHYAIFAVFLSRDLLKLSITEDKKEYLKSKSLNILFLGAFFIILILYNPWWELLNFSNTAGKFSPGDIYTFAIQIYIFSATVLYGIRISQLYTFFRFSPVKILAGSFLVMILMGTGLLMLPKATVEGSISFVDALFTSTSATCVTGLIVVDTATYFTRFGQWIILVLMQAGGLGIMTMTALFALILGAHMSIRGKLIMREVLADKSMERIGQTLMQVLGITIFIEVIGVIAMYQLFPAGAFPENERLFVSVFHSVSAFCNAGFTTFTDSLITFADKSLLISTFAGLIIIGGVGFPVIINLVGHRFFGTTGTFGKKNLRINIHSQIVVWVSLVLIIAGAIFIFAVQYLPEQGNPTEREVLASIFQSITARTAGFNTVHIGSMALPVIVMLMILMFIGASPGSTGGGVKTTSIFLSLYALGARLRGKTYLEFNRRTIPNKLVFRSFMVILGAQSVIALSFLLLTLTEDMEPMMLLFESVSAFGTVGLSMGATASLSVPGKVIILLTMYIGRIGPLALVIALGRKPDERLYEFPKETVILG